MKIIKHKVQAAYSGLYLVSAEEQRAEQMLKSVATDLGYCLHAWSLNTGRIDVISGQSFGEAAPEEVLDGVMGLPEKTILLLRDFHLILKSEDPMIFRKLKDALALAKTQFKTIVILASSLFLPAEMEKLFSVVEFEIPTKDELKSVLDTFCKENKKKMPDGDDLNAILDAGSGLTTNEFEDAIALSQIEGGTFSCKVISREKSGCVKKSGLMELIESKVTLADIGGLENLLADLNSKRRNFSQAAREYGLPSPRGSLVVGQAGTGKSLTAQATGAIFNVPLLRLEGGSLFGSLVGESERNWRSAFATARAIAPCILWIDEADGLFSGSKSSGATDGGTGLRVVKAIMQDMQFNSEGILFFFTANDIDGFPDALIDRLDVWSVDLPTLAERIAIWNIHIAKIRKGQLKGRSPKDFDVQGLAELTEGFSGRQIEQLWLKAMTNAFDANAKTITDKHVKDAASAFVPTSVTMAESIAVRRKRLQGRAMPAGIAEVSKPAVTGSRKIAS